jgi:hypothetical protein
MTVFSDKNSDQPPIAPIPQINCVLSAGVRRSEPSQLATDVIISNFVVVELKAVSAIGDAHLAQALSNLKASGLQLALILNFGEASLTWKSVGRLHFFGI